MKNAKTIQTVIIFSLSVLAVSGLIALIVRGSEPMPKDGAPLPQ